MDTDLFQILTLILLLGLLLTLFGVLQSLGAIRRTLEGRGSGEPAATSTAPSEAPVAAAETPAAAAQSTPEPETRHTTWAAGDVSQPVAAEPEPEPQPEPEPEPEPARTGWPAPQEAAVPSEEDPFRTAPAASAATEASDAGTSTGTGARVLYGDQGLTAATPNEAALRPAEREPEPEPEPANTATGAAAEDPQEQPFERDGRWWFRRGDELLVYEEQTGQWVAAGEPSSSGSVATTSGAAAEPAAAGAAPEGQVTTQQEAVGSFWKCPSCGAVNGSTATSCRMCFTARP